MAGTSEISDSTAAGYHVGTRDRIAAAAALIFSLVAVVLAINLMLDRFPSGLILLGFVTVALLGAWYGLVGAGPARVAGFTLAILALAAGLVFVLNNGEGVPLALATLVSLALAIAAARRAFRIRVPLPGAEAPEHPVLFFNPKSGGGKAEKFNLAEEAKNRGIEPVEMTPGCDLEQLVRDAVARGADGLAMAGGDGSQAVVATVASEEGLPYACIPAGTRNHFALDLGVDREDVVGALDAFVDAGERWVDLAEVNGRVFVNNVSLGVYAEAVQRDGYREAKLKTLMETLPEMMGPGAEGPDLQWRSPSGKRHASGAAILVSNNKYRLGSSIGSGTRPKIDDGLLGIATLADPAAGRRRLRSFQKPWRDWSAPQFEVDSDAPVPAGIDGEAATIDPPLRFSIRPGVLRVRVSRNHPGASPSAAIPDRLVKAVAALFRIAAGRAPADRAHPKVGGRTGKDGRHG